MSRLKVRAAGLLGTLMVLAAVAGNWKSGRSRQILLSPQLSGIPRPGDIHRVWKLWVG